MCCVCAVLCCAVYVQDEHLGAPPFVAKCLSFLREHAMQVQTDRETDTHRLFIPSLPACLPACLQLHSTSSLHHSCCVV